MARRSIVSQSRSLKDFDRRLKKLSESVSGKVVGQALRQASTPILGEARRLAPKGLTGLFRKSLRTGKGRVLRKYKNSGTSVVFIGPSRSVFDNNSPYSNRYRHRPSTIAHLIEFGHKNRDGSFTAPQPFMRPAFNSKKGEALKIFKKIAREKLEKEVAKGL